MVGLDFALLIMRVVTGLLFIGHGTQKLFGWFGGGGLEGTAQFFRKVGVRPAKFWALLAGLSEALGGLGLALGLLTPLAAAAIIGVMLTAMIKVHWQQGIWNTEHGIELPLVYTIIALVVGLVGPGAYSLDASLNIRYPESTFLIVLSLVVLGVIASLISGQIISQQQQGRKA
jgi:putative oxidoreductase